MEWRKRILAVKRAIREFRGQGINYVALEIAETLRIIGREMVKTGSQVLKLVNEGRHEDGTECLCCY